MRVGFSCRRLLMSDWIQLSAQYRRLTIIAACSLLTVMSMLFVACSGGGEKSEGKPGAETKTGSKEEHGRDETREVKLSEQAMKAVQIETAEVTEQSPDEILRVTGSVEINQQETQQVTPLVSGRVER